MKNKTGPKPKEDRSEVKQFFSIGVKKKFGTPEECRLLIHKLLSAYENKYLK